MAPYAQKLILTDELGIEPSCDDVLSTRIVGNSPRCGAGFDSNIALLERLRMARPRPP